MAIEKNRVKTAMMLIERCTDPSNPSESKYIENIDKFGDTPLIYATKENCLEIVLKLLEHGAEVNAKDKTGVTPLPLAVVKGHDEIALALIEAGADVAAKNKMGITPLLLAVDLNREDIALKLIESGSDLFAKNKRQYTPLHLAISNALFEVAVKLIECGASLHAKEWRNNKPFDLFTTESQKKRFFMEADFPNAALISNDHDLWFYLIQLSDMKGIEKRVLHYAQNNPDLARAKDGNGRVAVDIAAKGCKHAIQSIFLWHGRYRVIEGRPEHTSATCFVYRAVDEEDRDESGNPKRVALKLMRYKSQFLRELKARQFGFNSDYVVNVIATYPTYDASTDTLLLKQKEFLATPIVKPLRRSMLNIGSVSKKEVPTVSQSPPSSSSLSLSSTPAITLSPAIAVATEPTVIPALEIITASDIRSSLYRPSANTRYSVIIKIYVYFLFCYIV